MNNKQEIREDFCPPCLALIPLAFAGAGTGISATMDDKSDTDKDDKDDKDYNNVNKKKYSPKKKKKCNNKKRMKDIIFWSSIIIGIISLIIFILFRYVLCSKCR